MYNGSTRRGKRERGRKKIKEITSKNYLNFTKSIDLHIQEAQQTPNRRDTVDPHLDIS